MVLSMCLASALYFSRNNGAFTQASAAPSNSQFVIPYPTCPSPLATTATTNAHTEDIALSIFFLVFSSLIAKPLATHPGEVVGADMIGPKLGEDR